MVLGDISAAVAAGFGEGLFGGGHNKIDGFDGIDFSYFVL